MRWCWAIFEHLPESYPYFLVSVQILDGIGASIFGVSVLMVADLTKGTERFNLTQGILNTAIGIGAGLSNVKAWVCGYNVGFLILAAIAVVTLAVF